MAVDMPFFGHSLSPKLRLSKQLYHLLGEELSPWGVILTSPTGTEWQLFIVSRRDLLSDTVANWTMKSKKGQLVSGVIPYFGSSESDGGSIEGRGGVAGGGKGGGSGFEGYFSLLSQTCPAFVTLDFTEQYAMLKFT